MFKSLVQIELRFVKNLRNFVDIDSLLQLDTVKHSFQEFGAVEFLKDSKITHILKKVDQVILNGLVVYVAQWNVVDIVPVPVAHYFGPLTKFFVVGFEDSIVRVDRVFQHHDEKFLVIDPDFRTDDQHFCQYLLLEGGVDEVLLHQPQILLSKAAIVGGEVGLSQLEGSIRVWEVFGEEVGDKVLVLTDLREGVAEIDHLSDGHLHVQI